PFTHQVIFKGLNGEVVRVNGIFDDGTMVAAMSEKVYQRVKHRLGNWSALTRQLRMADGTVVPSIAKWEGEVKLDGISARGEFEVFKGGGWSFLFGKPLLQQFQAVHDYNTDEIIVKGVGGTALL
ncbi:hypothetical protein JAAARDRAFT_110759, partial [Jaapia argillacea MUCL 33604]